MKPQSPDALRRRALLLFLLPVPVLAASLLVGPSGSVGAAEVIAALTRGIAHAAPGTEEQSLAWEVVANIRAPRILLAFLVGGALGASGTALQAIARNPLVSPDILGLSAGAACGAALALSLPWLPLQPTAFVFGLGAAALSYLLARTPRGVPTVSLILAGVIVTALCTALLTVIQVFSDPFKLQTIVHWTMGNLHNSGWDKVRSASAPILLGGLWLVLLRWRLNILALGDVEARAVGLDPEREKLLVLVPAALAASASVAVAGIIGMVGLAVPHLVRMMVGPDNTRSLPASIAFGGTFLVLVDDLSRALTTFELPVGIFTTLIGGPFFIYLLRRAGAGFGGE